MPNGRQQADLRLLGTSLSLGRCLAATSGLLLRDVGIVNVARAT